MYSSLPSFILGFHGCDKKVGEKILAGGSQILPSKNKYDWLGHGSYFWEHNPTRALEYAELIKKYPGRSSSKINNTFVLGAIIDPGNCFNLLESHSLSILKQSHKLLKQSFGSVGLPLPKNKPIGDEKDLLLRKLDCAVFEYTHAYNKEHGVRPYDTVRGVFFEGNDLYPNAGFKEKNHIQICVRNPNCIIGFFRPLEIAPGHATP